MKIEKTKIKVAIHCADNSTVKGIIQISQGTRLSDFLSSPEKVFLIVTDAEVSGESNKTIFLNKRFIKSVEEI
jgi:ABC-type molybdate transport system substrate-binding protein